MSETLTGEQIARLEEMLAEAKRHGRDSNSQADFDMAMDEHAPALLAMAKRENETQQLAHDAFKIGVHHQERAEKAEAELAHQNAINDELLAMLDRIELRHSAEGVFAVQAERDEADRRAGAAERRLAWAIEEGAARAEWLHKAKTEWGADDGVSFDVVWAEALALRETSKHPDEPFQARVQPWMMECFGAEISADKVERGDRLLEEVFELLQSAGYDPARVLPLRNYVWGRPVGDPHQETGGVMVTLAAFCLAHDLDMHQAGEVELARISQPEIVLKIRAKQAAKPTGSALPIAMSSPDPARTCETCAHESVPVWTGPCFRCAPDEWPNWTPKTTASAIPKRQFGADAEEIYRLAVTLVRQNNKASASFVQRHLQIGYEPARNLIERMERDGIITKPNSAGLRSVISSEEAAP